MSKETWSGRRPSIAYMDVFGCVTYVMVSDERRGNFDANDTKCCKGTKGYRLIYL